MVHILLPSTVTFAALIFKCLQYNLNFNFGFKEDDFNNVSDLIEDNIETVRTNKEFDAFNNPKHEINFYNSKKWRLSGVPSMGGHGSALSIAKLYDLLANDLKLDLKKIISQKKFKKIIGLSDHSKTSVAAMTSCALGAKVIEKHIILDKS